MQTTFNLFAVSANAKETAINTEQTLDTGMLCRRGSMIAYNPRRESNINQAIGKEEADDIYDLGSLVQMDLEFDMCQAQHSALILAYALGTVSTAAWGTGYKHTITPRSGDLEVARANPSFTIAMRYAKQFAARYASAFIDSFKMTMKKDSWLMLTATLKATGKRSTIVASEDVMGAYNASNLTLSANGLDGSDANTRLDAIHQVKVQVPTTLEWNDVTVTAASNATPAVITITPPGGNNASTTYRILYNSKITGGLAWATFPSRVVEPPLRISDFIVKVGAKWDGSAITGGHSIGADIKEFSWEFSNGITPEFVPGGTTGYASRALRSGRTQRITLDRDFRDYILGRYLDNNEDFVIQAIATGSEFESGKNYFINIVFPKVRIMAAPSKEDGTRLGETADIIALEDSTYGSVWTQIGNKVSAYAA
jgi:hypothetical protein